MITQREIRSPDRHRHLPLHGRRGIDEASARAWRGGIRGRARRAPPPCSRGVRRRGRRRSRHPRGRVLRGVPIRSGSSWLPLKRSRRRSLSGPISLRIGLHTGTPLVTGEGYVGDDVHFAARVAASGHGGQVLLSQSARELVDGSRLTDLGEHRLKDIEGAVSIYQLGDETFPPLKTISNTNLPRPASSFIGREREREEVVREAPGWSPPRHAHRARAAPARRASRSRPRPSSSRHSRRVSSGSGSPPSASPRSCRRRSRRRSGARGRARRAHRRARDAPPPRQPGAGDRGCA